MERQLRTVPQREEHDGESPTANMPAAAGTSASALQEDLGSTTASAMDDLDGMDGRGTRSLGGLAQFMEVWVAIKPGGSVPRQGSLYGNSRTRRLGSHGGLGNKAQMGWGNTSGTKVWRTEEVDGSS